MKELKEEQGVWVEWSRDSFAVSTSRSGNHERNRIGCCRRNRANIWSDCEELVLRKAALVAGVERFVSEYVELNVMEIVREETKLERRKCKCSNQIK